MTYFPQYLGYTYSQPIGYLEPTGYFLTKCESIVADLAILDAKIKEANDRVLVNNVGDLSVDYSRQLLAYRSQANNLLHELAHILNLQIQFNPYVRKYGSSFHGGL